MPDYSQPNDRTKIYLKVFQFAHDESHCMRSYDNQLLSSTSGLAAFHVERALAVEQSNKAPDVQTTGASVKLLTVVKPRLQGSLNRSLEPTGNCRPNAVCARPFDMFWCKAWNKIRFQCSRRFPS
jgi:hypothetical protein